MGYDDAKVFGSRIMKKWYQRKTFWAAAVLAATAILSSFTSLNPEHIKAIQTVLAALSLMFIRDAIEKK